MKGKKESRGEKGEEKKGKKKKRGGGVKRKKKASKGNFDFLPSQSN
jgi:hypothetical protein